MLADGPGDGRLSLHGDRRFHVSFHYFLANVIPNSAGVKRRSSKRKAHDVARLDAYFVGDAKIAGGLLANIQQGTGFVFEQEFINNEVWLPTYEEANVGARVLLVKGFRVSDVTRYSDHKKTGAENLSTIRLPKP